MRPKHNSSCAFGIHSERNPAKNAIRELYKSLVLVNKTKQTKDSLLLPFNLDPVTPGAYF